MDDPFPHNSSLDVILLFKYQGSHLSSRSGDQLQFLDPTPRLDFVSPTIHFSPLSRVPPTPEPGSIERAKGHGRPPVQPSSLATLVSDTLIRQKAHTNHPWTLVILGRSATTHFTTQHPYKGLVIRHFRG